MKRRFAGAVGAARMGVGGRRSPGLLIANGLARLGAYRVDPDLVYGTGPRQRLDVYRPVGDAQGRPVVVFFHGGSWMGGAKDEYLFVAQALVSRGFVAVVANYRLFPAVRFPVFVQDAALAVRWAHAGIGEYGGDSRRLFVMGHSAGAHIAALLALDAGYLQAVGGNSHWLRGMIGLAGAYDWLDVFSETDKKIFGPADRYALSQPVNFVEGDEPPLLLLHGERDSVVRVENTLSLAARVRARNGRVEVRRYPRLGHVGIVGALSLPLRFRAPVLGDVSRFVDPRLAAR